MSRGAALLWIVVATAVLYLAREVLIPLALAILFTFLLAPAVRRLESWRVHRITSTALVSVVALAVVIGVFWAAFNQFVSLAGKLPEYRENIVAKIRTLRSPPKGQLGKAAEAIKDLQQETRESREQPPKSGQEREPVPLTPLELIGKLGVPLLTLAATSLAVIIFTVLMLLQRDDLRDRVIRLAGPGRMNATTRALADAGQRVSRYLMMQLVVNALYGVPLGIALYFIGIPNAALWGLLAMLLRFIPYFGAWIAASMPIALAFAISEGWALVAWTGGVILVLELVVAYVIEPWVYGASTGLSPLAIIGAVIFWTWLWGPIGTLMATPLTVCIAAVGRHVPQFGFLNVLLGVEPVLAPEMRFYQRLVALDQEEAAELAHDFVEKHGEVALCDELFIPAIGRAKRGRERDELSERRSGVLFDAIRRIAEETIPEKPPAAERALCIVAARDQADELAAALLARLLPSARVTDEAQAECNTVLISAVPPHSVAHAVYLCRSLSKRLPKSTLIVGLWISEVDVSRAATRLRKAGAAQVLTRFGEALEKLR